MKAFLKNIVVMIITWQAKTVLRKYNPKIVAVTGSVGKTSTKDAIYTLISRFYYARKSEKSFNSEVGIPLTVLGLPNGWNDPLLWFKNIFEGFALILLPNLYPDWLVLEVGADRPGDIESITKWIKPDISVVTRLSKVPVHVEFFRSVHDLVKEKSFLVLNTKRDGVVVLNADDEDVVNFGNLVPNHKIYYGTAENADVIGRKYKIIYDSKKHPEGIGFDIDLSGEESNIEIKGAIGMHQMYQALGAFAVGKALSLLEDGKKISIAKMKKSFENLIPTPGRMRVIPGLKNSTIIDDTYNSSPVALIGALGALDDIKTKGRKIAVLGDMLELGIYSGDEHKKAGEYAHKSADLLFTVGLRSRYIAEGALNDGMDERNIFQFDDSRKAGKELEMILAPGDVVLVKGSQGVRMERVVEEIMENPEKKNTLLVRQEVEWMNR